MYNWQPIVDTMPEETFDDGRYFQRPSPHNNIYVYRDSRMLSTDDVKAYFTKKNVGRAILVVLLVLGVMHLMSTYKSDTSLASSVTSSVTPSVTSSMAPSPQGMNVLNAMLDGNSHAMSSVSSMMKSY